MRRVSLAPSTIPGVGNRHATTIPVRLTIDPRTISHTLRDVRHTTRQVQQVRFDLLPSMTTGVAMTTRTFRESDLSGIPGAAPTTVGFAGTWYEVLCD